MLAKVSSSGHILDYRFFDFGGEDGAVKTVRLGDNNNIVMGYYGVSTDSVYILSVTDNLDINWLKTIKPAGNAFNWYNAGMIATNDGGFVFTGQMRPSFSLLVLKFAADGTQEWAANYVADTLKATSFSQEPSFDEHLLNLMELPDMTGYLITTSLMTKHDALRSGALLDNSDLLVLKIASDGNIVWSVAVDQGGMDYGRAVMIENATEYWVAGFSIPIPAENRKLMLISLADDGSLNRNTSLEDSTNQFRPFQLFKDSAGSRIMMGDIVKPGPNSDIFIFSMDAVGTYSDASTLNSAAGIARGYSLLQNTYGLIVSGHCSYGTSGSVNREAFLASFDAEMQTGCHELFETYTPDMPTLGLTDDVVYKDTIIVSENLISYDTLNFILTQDIICATVGIEENSIRDGISTFYNPALQQLTVNFPENMSIRTLSIYNLQGIELIREDLHPGQASKYVISTERLATGCYILHAACEVGYSLFSRFVSQ